MNNDDLKGLFSALLVSYNQDGYLNEKGLRQIVRHNIDNMEMDGLYVGGSTGENFLIDTATKKRIFEIVKDEAKDSIKLIAQVGGNDIFENKELARFATELGYDALSAVTPFYYPFSFQEIKEYYNMIMEDVDNRMIVYYIPFLTKVNMNLDQFGELFAHPKIVGVKYTQADFFLMERLRKTYPDTLIYAGFDEMMLPALVNGVDGGIGSTYNVNGKRARMIYDLVKNGEIEKALEVQHITNDLISAILDNGLYPTLKEILKLQGADAGYSRRPMASASETQKQRAKEIYETYLRD